MSVFPLFLRRIDLPGILEVPQCLDLGMNSYMHFQPYSCCQGFRESPGKLHIGIHIEQKMKADLWLASSSAAGRIQRNLGCVARVSKGNSVPFGTRSCLQGLVCYTFILMTDAGNGVRRFGAHFAPGILSDKAGGWTSCLHDRTFDGERTSSSFAARCCER